MIPYPYTKSGSGIPLKIYWGYSVTAIGYADAFALPLSASKEELILSVSNSISLDWNTKFATIANQSSNFYQWILLPDRNPNFPLYNYYDTDLQPAPPPNPNYLLNSKFTINTSAVDADNNPYTYYIKILAGALCNYNFYHI